MSKTQDSVYVVYLKRSHEFLFQSLVMLSKCQRVIKECRRLNKMFNMMTNYVFLYNII